MIIVVPLTQLDVLQRPRESLDGTEVVLLQQHHEFMKDLRKIKKDQNTNNQLFFLFHSRGVSFF